MKIIVTIAILAFLLRFLPRVINGSPLSYDELLHKYIIENVQIKIYKDVSFLIGIDPYSYPVIFYLVAKFLKDAIGIDTYDLWFLPAIFGTFVAIIFYIFLKKLFNERIAIVSSLLVASLPSLIYRTSIIIPESFGIFLFTVSTLSFLLYLNNNDRRYLIVAILALLLHLFIHRSWMISLMTISLIYLFHAIHKSFKRKSILIGSSIITMILFGILAISFLQKIPIFGQTILARIPLKPVTALGYIKWIGIVQFFAALAGILISIKNYFDRKLFTISFVTMVLLILGAVSFRFRDPYAGIFSCIMASVAILKVLDFISKEYGKNVRIVFALILSLAIFQGILTSILFVKFPIKIDKEAIEFIKNYGDDGRVLTWKEEGYIIVGETFKNDVYISEKLINPIITGRSISIEEAKKLYSDLFAMFSSTNEEYVKELIEKYNVSLLYIDYRMYSMGILRSGIISIASYSPYFKPLFANGKSTIYKYVPKPIEEFYFSEDLCKDKDIARFLKRFWNKYHFTDFSNDIFKGYFEENSRMLFILKDIGCDEKFINKLILWLKFKSLPNGSYIEGTPPDEYTLTNLRIFETVYKFDREYMSKELEDIMKRLERFLKKLRVGNNIKISPNIDFKNEPEIFKDELQYKFYKKKLLVKYASFLKLIGNSSDDLIEKVLHDIKRGIIFYNNTAYDVPILIDIVRYYNDSKLFSILRDASRDLSKRLLKNGTFIDDNGYSISLYADAACIFYKMNMNNSFNIVFNHILNFDIDKIMLDYPLDRISYTYYILRDCIGKDFALKFLKKIVNEYYKRNH